MERNTTQTKITISGRLRRWFRGIFCNPLVREGRFIGRRKLFTKVYKMQAKRNITVYELSLIVEGLCDGGWASWVERLPENTQRHFKEMSKEEFDYLFNPEMEIDQGED